MTDRETLSATDDPYRRAQKAWKIMGFSDTFYSEKRSLDTLAEVFMMYRDLDKKNEM